MSNPRLPPKKDVALALLETSTVLVHLDPRLEEVRVPPWFKKQPQLVLQIGLNMPVPIPDLNVDDEAISCTLSFNRSPHYCLVPWAAVYALVGEDGRGMVWPDSVPPEVAAQAEAAQKKAEQRSHLRAVPAEAEAGEAQKRKKRKKAKRPKPEEASSASTEPEPARGDGAEKPGQPEENPGDSPAVGGEPLQSADGEDEAPAKKRGERKLAAVRDPADEAASDGDEEQKPGKRKLPPYLRVVK